MSLETQKRPEIEAQPLDQNQVAELSLDAAPVGTLVDEHGVERQVHAYVDLPSAADGPSPQEPLRLAFSIMPRQENGHAPLTYTVIGQQSHRMGTTRTSLGFHPFPIATRHSERPYGISIGSIAPSRENPAGALAINCPPRSKHLPAADKAHPPQIEADPASLHIEKASDFRTFLSRRNKPYNANREADHKSRSLARKFAAGLVAWSVLHAGGLLDRTIEPFHNAGDSVQATYEHPGQYYDGSPETFYSSLANRHESDPIHSYDDAVNAVAETMDTWDAGDMDKIHADATAFRERHKSDLMPESQVDDLRHRLKAAADNTRALAVIDEFLDFYGKNAVFLPEDVQLGDNDVKAFDHEPGSVEDVKAFGNELINAFWYLPRGFVSRGQFNTIELGSGGSAHAFDSLRKSLLFGVDMFDSPLYKASSLVEPVVAIVQPFGPTRVILHEVAHSRSFNWMHSLGREGEVDNPLARGAGHIASALVGIPSDNSLYGAIKNEEEGYAESAANALDACSDQFLASPNEWRSFISSGNKWAMAVAIRHEAEYAGMTAYLIDVNQAYKRQNLSLAADGN